MEYTRIISVEEPLFTAMHELMQRVFPPEEVLDAALWAPVFEDDTIRVCAAVHEGEVVGVTEYRYNPTHRVAMTDFTIISKPGLGIGRFLYRNRQKDLLVMAGGEANLLGMFAEIYDPYRHNVHTFGDLPLMSPVVRREVLSHLGYMRLDLTYVHPSWENDGEAVEGLDFCFLPTDESLTELSAALVAAFLQEYYAVLPNKPQAWLDMIEQISKQPTIRLLPI